MNSSEPVSAIPSSVIWQAASCAPIATRIAVAGDFLPAGNLTIRADSCWADLAAPLLPHLEDVSTTFANLECCVGVDNLPARAPNGIGQIVSTRPEALHYLSSIKCHSVGIANNHAYDFGEAGVQRTRGAILRHGLHPVGAGHTLGETPETFLWRGPRNFCIGFWAAAKASRELATRKSPGVEAATSNRAAEALAIMKQQGANFFVALLHSGCLRANRPAPEDVALLRSLADCGFDLIASSHSHRIAGFEMIPRSGQRPAFCFYGLGSIVSGYITSELEREGLIAVAGFDARGTLAEISVRPVYIAENGFGEVPSRVTASAILERFAMLSSEIRDGSYSSAFYREISQGLVRLYVRDVRAAFLASGVAGLARKAMRIRLHHVKRLIHGVFAT